ncbi:MFS transporter [Kitasatospora sp. MAP5-34]|uniref:MFS transporter n=1 Tax=Kitasatospora sp. MAP5-34 TaxID=3035102 RepID=UPI002473D0DE|nr:MFS transporter [Kitasatospora sp. MAP5-34]MDH6574465.1 MFS family permease [Kitasatospora sp. MAP5-34]
MFSTRQYGQIWRVPGAPLLLVGGVVARLGMGVTVLAWLLLIKQTTGSYGLAASVGAATSVATACAAPIGGRLADRFGPGRVLLCFATVYSLTQLGLLAAVLERMPVPLLCAVAALSGAFFPSVGPALRAAWTVLTGPDSGRSEARTAAMAAESTLFEVVFVVGPLLVSGFMLFGKPLGSLFGTTAAIAGPAAALAASALLTGLGTLALTTGRAMRGLRPTPGQARARGLGALRAPGFPLLLLCAAGIAFSFGASPVALAAYARVHDGDAAESVTGVLIAVWSIGSAVAGFWYGTRQFRASQVRQFVVLLVGLAAGYAIWALMPDSLTLGVALLLTGAVIAPAMTVEAGLVARLAPESMLNEAYTWLTTTNLSMAALGSAAGGVIVDHPGGWAWGFMAAAVATAVAAGVAAWPGALSPRGDRAEELSAAQSAAVSSAP